MPVASSRAPEIGPVSRAPNPRWLLVALIGLVLALSSGFLLAMFAESHLGHLSRHMAAHIFLMNVVAPLIALLLVARGLVRASTGAELVGALVLQIGLLWAWHSPSGLVAAHDSVALLVMAQASLLAAALWFWLAVLSQVQAARWRAIAALLLTGKLFCLLGALLTFAPRPLFAAFAHAHHHYGGEGAPLADQQLAGLMMLAACPATYVLAGVVLAARWLNELLAEAP